MADPYAFPPMPGLAPMVPQQPVPASQLPPLTLAPMGAVSVSPRATLAPAPSPLMLTLDQPAGPPRPPPALAPLPQDIQIDSGPTDLRPLMPTAAPAQAPAGVDPSRLVTGRAQAPAAPAGGGAGAEYLAQWNNLVDAQKRELLSRPQGGPGRRPQAPEPLVRLGRLQDEAGKIDKAAATFDRDIAYRRADNAGDLVGEQEAGIRRLEDFDAQAQQRTAAARQRLDAMNAQLASGEFDPDRLWHKASEARKAGFMAASILSGIGQSVAGRGGQQNSAVQGLFEMMDRDNRNQIESINQGRQKASDAAKLYRDVVEQTGSDRAALAALNIAKLDAMKNKFEAEYQALAAKMPIAGTKVDLQYGTPYVIDAQGKPLPGAKIDAQGRAVDPRTGRPIPGARVETPTTGTGQPLPTTMLDLRLQKAQNEIGQRRAQEELTLAQAIAAATKPVGGGGMTKEQQLAKLAALTKSQVEAQRDANKDAAAAGRDQHAVFVGGQKLAVDPNAPKEAAFEAQKKINMAEMGLATIDSMEKRLQNAPAAGYAEKGARLVGADRIANLFADEARLLGTDQVTGLMSQLSGAGVPSETQARLYQQILAGGPGAMAALGEARRVLHNGKQTTIQNLGVR